MEVISRKEAREMGLNRYFTGKECPRGHLEIRRVDSGACMQCARDRANSVPDEVKKARNAAYYSKNAESQRKRAADYRKNNPEKQIESATKYRINNKEKLKNIFESWKSRNPDYFSSYKKRFPEKSRTHCRNRYARKKNAEGSHTAANIISIYASQSGLCALCGVMLIGDGSKSYHVDHIIPLSRGGSNWPSNLQILCQTCNLKKGNKLPSELA